MHLSNGNGSMLVPSSSASWKVAGDVVYDQFPASLRVMVVDDDPTCLKTLDKMLRNCLYEVTQCNRAEQALKLLRENKNGFDIVISDVHMPDMDGFKLLEHIGLEMDLPVIMMSANDGKNVVMKAVTHGACDYLIKPVRIEALKNIWQHVVRKRKNEWKELEQSSNVEEGDRHQKPSEDADYSSSTNEGSWKNSKWGKDKADKAEEREDTSALKKPRVVWSVELHQQFVAAVYQLGIDKAVPQKILELMNVPGLTRENVASHLQKYRLYLTRLSGVSQHQSGVTNSFIGTQEATFGPMPSLNGLDLQALAVSGQLPVQSLATLQAAGFGSSTPKSGMPMPRVDQRNLFGFEYSKRQQLSNSGKQINLLRGIPTTMEAKQLANLHQSAPSLGGMNMQQPNAHGPLSSSLLMQVAQQQSRGRMLNETTGSHVSLIPSSIWQPVLSRNRIADNGRRVGYNPLSQSSSMLDFPTNHTAELLGNSFPNTPGIPSITSKGSFQEEVNSEIKGSRGFVPSYDIFNELHQHKSHNWELQNAVLTFDASQHANSVQGSLGVSPSVLVHQGVSSNQRSGENGNTLAVSNAMFSSREGNERGNEQNFGQHLIPLLVDSSLRVKAEIVSDASCETALFHENFSQEDLMNVLLKQVCFYFRSVSILVGVLLLLLLLLLFVFGLI